MKQSHLFTKTRHEVPKDEVAKNAQLLIRAGYINKEMSGVYSYLPLGLRVMNKVVNIIREEMNSIGGQEVHLAALQDRKLWEATGRWDDSVVDNWFKTKLKNGGDIGLGFTHEEPLTNLMKDHIRSFRDLPIAVYQFQTKFRNEERAKSGIMRAREFLMKDLYSFNVDEKSHQDFYEEAKKAYIRVFDRLGIGAQTYVTFAAGGSFSKYSHEFQTITDAGEDIIYVHKDKRLAVNRDVLNDEVLKDLRISRSDLEENKAVEVGNIFSLGAKFSDALGLNYKDAEGKLRPVIMGSYGIGPGRVMGTIAELWSDDKGLVWPESVSPFAIHLIALFDSEGKVKKVTDDLYEKLTKKSVEVLYDDREETAGTKFSDSDLIGISKRIVVSEKTLRENSVETKDRRTGKVEMVKSINDLLLE
ncbi:MAG: prolyl-tRNA synthetase [Candidatus Taylorbacteria bacterium RIFCSPHIGHO2_02_FULL_45_28]|uniref:Proline--tRNA ligase n=1 Tax=Candidatus Taylorbacteria bacterium RIFCSPHIGHO2_12_FULL_45_16 TaxID=1802315 RepID=A0A1G2MZF8_9BACT|nr:MAG: prolyl-tRNA synthetase [Candidatus Taylorbacteria bacterium RIFCSPHIGHO2_01_FULL_44_110]OHA25526.1 MAG: prolyl-tRNA synthetase [Candidatus Taylorbacteria bacterium RIFCSPHIGHO2_02_FULL_45_28]OHA29193.1 MAG: prolyl-tRNA synthetase [Candidatus Taylorbacteria bacterium RIFCSPHIGHO2_12_FULL_45_16]OHA33415.1 MAG: prolyl-tRNA synthetase [Candidatus Taylorbacteria bacterium RIFCSPLOWO2_01_FULL_45_59]OHA43652.1 MAG: prolyl-tRNA synthetase [Candidatus Taylorbacteria bacterium RIFCSPLOWO2_12_FULL